MEIIKSFKSKDGKTVKYLQRTSDDHVIETGYYNLDEHIICISSQIGCALGCVFCATAKPIDYQYSEKSFVRNLTSEEIVQQATNVIAQLPKHDKLKTKPILFSYLGMGEPLANYKNVVNSIKILSREFLCSRTTIATLGINPDLIKKLAHEKINTILKLHLSLHAPDDALRRKILPKAREIKPALEALKYFSLKKNAPAKINYILIRNINDSPKHAGQLADLLKPYPFTVKLSNLNDFNNLKNSAAKNFHLFEKTLNASGIKTCRFTSTGTDIEAGCGQLRRRYYKQ